MSATDSTVPQDHLISNKLYDKLVPIVQVALPALATFYAALAGLWDFPKVQEVVGTITALTALLGVFLNLATRSYNNSESKYDGVIKVDTNDDTGAKLASIELKNYENPLDVVKQDQVLFKVEGPPEL